MTASDTIVAPATPPGEGGIAIVRLSGAVAQACLQTVFRGSLAVAEMDSHRLYHGRLYRADDTLVDDVLAVVMRGPHSYTGEDVVELHCHGGSQVLRSVLDLMLSSGARLAGPGEFTQRAFLNGKLDLSQAEAVIDVIRSRSERACQVALGQLDGRLSRLVHQFNEQLRSSLAYLEAHIDFPDDEVGQLDPVAFRIPLVAVNRQIERLLGSFDVGRLLRDGINLLIFGRPNVGKSSLLNALLGESRAIVTEIPGTTRDTLEEQLVIGGVPVRLIDTAGIRETDDPVEVEGVRRAQQKAAAADLVLLVIDGTQGFTLEDADALAACESEKTLLVVNKCDLGVTEKNTYPPEIKKIFHISSKTSEGLSCLQDAVVEHLLGESGGERVEDVVLTERRHREALLGANAALLRLEEQLCSGLPLECLAVELREALSSLGQITGETAPDEILEQIFSRFCVGK